MFTFVRGLQPPDMETNPSIRIANIHKDQRERNAFLLYNITTNTATNSMIKIDSDRIACFDGILVNAHNIVDSYALPGIDSLLDKPITEQTIAMLSDMHGQFSGMVFDTRGEGLFFVNQTGSSRLYYWHSGISCIVSTSLSMIVATLRGNGISCRIDGIGARMIMCLGFTLADYTTISDIKLLEPGHYLRIERYHISKHQYHCFSSEPLHTSISKSLPIVNDLFREAVRMEYDWDVQHSKQHLAFLSGGLDSRMSLYTAASLGFKDIDCMNFSQSGYLDHTIAREIAANLKLGYHFYPLDKGEYLLQMEDAMAYSEGQIIFHGAAHLYAALGSVDTHSYGVMHSGQVGDLILGSFLYAPQHDSPGSRSIGLGGDANPELNDTILSIAANYPTQEIFALYNRAFNAASNGDLACSITNHAISPFLYPPFTQYCLNIHPTLRFANKLYLEWFRKYQPEAARLRWEKTGLPLTASNKALTVAKLVRRAKDKLARMGLLKADGMNPFDLWLRDGTTLRAKLITRFSAADKYNIVSASDAGSLYKQQATSPHLSSRFQAYTAAYSLNRMLGDSEPWIPDRFTGGFPSKS